jgi:hypothetical protein
MMAGLRGVTFAEGQERLAKKKKKKEKKAAVDRSRVVSRRAVLVNCNFPVVIIYN